MPFRSDKRLYVNADKSKVVEEDSPEAAFLLVGEGGTVSDEDAKKYGLKAPQRTEVTEVESESKQEPEPENKARTMRTDRSSKG